MKKFLCIMLLTLTSLPVFANVPAEIIQVHDMQMINEQRFRREVINDYNDVKQEKERYQKRNKIYKPTVETSIVPVKSEPVMINDKGKIKIQY